MRSLKLCWPLIHLRTAVASSDSLKVLVFAPPDSVGMYGNTRRLEPQFTSVSHMVAEFGQPQPHEAVKEELCLPTTTSAHPGHLQRLEDWSAKEKAAGNSSSGRIHDI
jgi:hypothetical protein